MNWVFGCVAFIESDFDDFLQIIIWSLEWLRFRTESGASAYQQWFIRILDGIVPEYEGRLVGFASYFGQIEAMGLPEGMVAAHPDDFGRISHIEDDSTDLGGCWHLSYGWQNKNNSLTNMSISIIYCFPNK